MSLRVKTREKDPEIVVIYHGECWDGFAGAFAAYKKFGTNARYIPVTHDSGKAIPPPGIRGKDIYLIDYAYKKESLQKIAAVARKLTIIDHHKSNLENVLSFKESVFDLDHSGAWLAWKHFHPNTPVPTIIKYIEDGDMWNYRQPNSKQVKNLLHTEPLTFERLENLLAIFKNAKARRNYIRESIAVDNYRNRLIQRYTERAQLVRFGKYKVFAVEVHSFFRSEVGHLLAEKTGLFGIVWRLDGTTSVHVSLRSSGTVDVSKIAKKYGGGGHANAASFSVDTRISLPFKKIK